MPKTENSWSEEWPVEPGWYWFYGITHKCQDDPSMCLVQVRGIREGVLYIWKSSFLNKEEGAKGKWMLAELPSPPTE